MKNLPLPSRESARRDLETAITRYRYRQEWRGHALTPAELGQILAIYDHYDLVRGVACAELQGEGFAPTLITELEKAYDKTQEKRKLFSLRTRLFKAVTLCPICGIDPAVELDHFLPRAIFKPLAIYPRNLVPVCHACNHTKLAGFGNEDAADQQFVHAYFDILPDVQFLTADVALEEGGLIVNFSVAGDAAIPVGMPARLNNQITALRLNSRYAAEVNSYVTGHAVALHLQYRAGGQQNVRSFLRMQARYETGAFYRNHWRPTLLRSLAASGDFTNGGFADVLPIHDPMLDDLLGE